jgi:hypothetical protein
MPDLEIHFDIRHRNFIIFFYSIIAIGVVISFIPLVILLLISFTTSLDNSIRTYFVLSLPFYFIFIYGIYEPLIDAINTPNQILFNGLNIDIKYIRKNKVLTVNNINEVVVIPYRRITHMQAKQYWIYIYYDNDSKLSTLKFDLSIDEHRKLFIDHLRYLNNSITVSEKTREQILP